MTRARLSPSSLAAQTTPAKVLALALLLTGVAFATIYPRLGEREAPAPPAAPKAGSTWKNLARARDAAGAAAP